MAPPSTEASLAAVALIVSLVALLATFMQVLQQYYASALGYTNCNEKVMGDWAKTKTRRFSWDELRYEVQYDAPVIFVCPPENERGPILGATIYFLDGTDKSLKETWSVKHLDQRKEYSEMTEKERVHTSDNELASWFILLYAVQRMEAKSSEWQAKQYTGAPPGALAARYGVPMSPPTLIDSHTMTVALQRKRKSWDTMPKTMTKPYATTTMCHMIEMLAALGIYWKEFDRRRDRYWAEGNGFLVLGERVTDLGIVFSLQIHGQCTFERNRVIPVDQVKELTFGYVPTVYRDNTDQSRLEVPSDMPEDLSSLQMGSDREIAESLTIIGCNTNAVNYFLEEGKRTSHIFPLAFEILGMLCQNLHINNSSFTYIPNPTAYSFDKRSFSLRKLLEAFRVHFQEETETTRNHVIVDTIRKHVDEVLEHYSEKDGPGRVLCLRVLHMAIDDTDEILTAKKKQPPKKKTAPAPAPAAPSGGINGAASSHSPNVIISPAEPADANQAAQGETTLQSLRRETVQDVLRSHIQEVLRLLNERDERPEGQTLHVHAAERRPPSPTQTRFPTVRQSPPPSFEDVDDASPDERQDRFMDVYFEVIRARVVPKATFSTDRRLSVIGDRRPSSLPSMRAPRDISRGPSLAPRPGSSRGGSSVGRRSRTPRPDSPLFLSGDEAEGDVELVVMDSVAVADSDDESVTAAAQEGVNPATDRRARSRIPLWSQPASHDDVWCTLVFRMICWLMLHDVNKLDTQLSKSELLGSRVPVYIA